ncbi:MAG: hypothetical protein AAF384_06110 [Pseudomonadota bacterium]
MIHTGHDSVLLLSVNSELFSVIKEAFLSAMLAGASNPNSTEIKLVEVHKPHFDGHTIVEINRLDATTGTASIVKQTDAGDAS